MPDGKPDAPQTEVERLTIQAVQAAERGDWDAVEAYVDSRGALLPTAALAKEARERVLVMDARLGELAAQAKTALSMLLMEAGRTRKRLEQLQRGHTASDPGSAPIMTIRA